MEARYEILRVHTRAMTLDPDVDLRQLAEDTELFTGAELKAICNEAGIVALREDISSSVVCNRHFLKVKESVKPALTREEIASYASFAKDPLPKSISKDYRKEKKNSLAFKSPVSIGVVSLLLYAGMKYFFMSPERVPKFLAST